MKKQCFQPPNEMNVVIAMMSERRLQARPQGQLQELRPEIFERTWKERIIDISVWSEWD